MSPAFVTLLVTLLAAAVTSVQCAYDQQQQPQQQQQQPAAGLHITPDELWRLVDRAVAAATQPLTIKLDSRIDTLDARLDTLDARLDVFDSRLDVLDSRMDASVEHQHKHESELSSVKAKLESMASRLEEKANKLDDHELRLQKQRSRADAQESRQDVMTSQLDSQKSQLDEQASQISGHDSRIVEQTSQLDSQQSLMDNHTSHLGNHDSQLDEHASQIDQQESQLSTVLNRTVSHQAQIDGITIRLNDLQTLSDDPPARDCSDLPAGSRSGVYLLRPGLDGTERVPAFCELETDGGNWTVLQRRADIQPRQDFYRGWAAYREGFGELDGEFWWGLGNIWTVTASRDRRYELRINLEDFDGEKRYAVYQGFRVSSEEDGYRLAAGNYSGDAGDSLARQFGQRFTTRDRDQDSHSTINCANHKHSKAGWWYNDCWHSNLNGRYLIGQHNDEGGMAWKDFRGWHYSLKNVEMKIRPSSKLQKV